MGFLCMYVVFGFWFFVCLCLFWGFFFGFVWVFLHLFCLLMEAKEVIHCLKLISLLEPFLSRFLSPLTSGICHSNTSAHSRGEGEWFHQKQMPKCSLYGLGQWSPLSAAVQPDFCFGIFSNPKRSQDNALLILMTGLSPTLQKVLMGSQSQKIWRARFCPAIFIQ